MSKLAHSNQEIMDQIEREAIAADDRGERTDPPDMRQEAIVTERDYMSLCVTSPSEFPMSGAAFAAMWEKFLREGTTHSARAASLPLVIRRCEREGIPYVLFAVPGKGYFIRQQRVGDT